VLPVFDSRHDVSLGRPIASQFVSHDDPRDIAQALESRAEDTCGRILVTSGLPEDVERVPVLIHCSPERVVPAVHGAHDVVPVPPVSTSRLSAPKGIGIGLPELERPLSDGFIADDHPARGQDFFDIPEASRETKVAPHRVADELGRIPVACIGIPLLVHRQNLAHVSFLGKLTVPPRPD